MSDRSQPPSRPDRPTLRPGRQGGGDGAARPAEDELLDDAKTIATASPLDELDELEVLIGEAEKDMSQVAPVLESGRPPENPPRQLPAIGHFGDYAIVGRLALGGMAEILLAREEAIGAGSRYLVVKRILPEYEQDEAFVQMFLDEARVMMRLKHPNVVHVYKFGKEDHTHYIAMEWVNGVSLGKLIRRARQTGGIPIPVACKIISSVAEALEHAHEARGEGGQPLGLVHRDVTPDNIMISFDGSVKLLDFGIAKAQSRAHKTQAGVVKGKFAYMAPEQCRARELDRRVDVFAMGVCLYEAISGRPLYRRETEFETMEAIVRGPIPRLSDRVPDAPAQLEAILARCLAKRPEDRFATAGELQEALDAYVTSFGKVVNTRRLKEMLEHLFKDEQNRGPMVDTTPFGSSFHAGSSADVFKLESGESDAFDLPIPTLDGLDPGPSPAAPITGGARELDPGSLALDPGSFDLDPSPRLDSTRPNSLSAKAGSSLVSADPTAPTPGSHVARRPAPTAPARSRPPQPEPEGGGALKWVLGGGIALALIAGGAYFVMEYVLAPAPVVAPAVDVTVPVLTGSLEMHSEPEGATLFVDDEEIGTTPTSVSSLDTGQHDVRLTLEGHTTHEGTVEIRADRTTTITQPLIPLEVPADDGPTGTLNLTCDPAATVFLGERELGTTPLRNVEVPAGLVALELVTPDGERHRRGVMVRADERTSTHLDLRE